MQTILLILGKQNPVIHQPEFEQDRARYIKHLSEVFPEVESPVAGGVT